MNEDDMIVCHFDDEAKTWSENTPMFVLNYYRRHWWQFWKPRIPKTRKIRTVELKYFQRA